MTTIVTATKLKLKTTKMLGRRKEKETMTTKLKWMTMMMMRRTTMRRRTMMRTRKTSMMTTQRWRRGRVGRQRERRKGNPNEQLP
jgi:hypothetical protein